MAEIKPQAGAQELFLSSSADIVIYGGAAGGGKSWGILLEPLRHVTTNPEFYATIFRRNTVQIRNQGGLWDESVKLYQNIKGAEPIQTTLEWRFKGGGRVKFAHLEHDKTVYNYQGSQIPFIGFDELCHFSEAQFFYMMSRNRSMCGVTPYIRATCNPDAESWVAEFIAWWIDEQGYAIKERSGIIRWFIRDKGQIYWSDTRDNCILEHGKKNLDINDAKQVKPKSVTFIMATLDDNPAMTDADPNYRSNLESLPIVEQERLLNGNWKIKYDTGLVIFAEESLLVDGKGVQYPKNCTSVFAVLDTALKDGLAHDGTGVTYFAYNNLLDPPLIILDWDIVQINSALLKTWLPSVFQRLEYFAGVCGARNGAMNFIEDKASGITLLQECALAGYSNVRPIPSELTAMGKSGRAIDTSGAVYQNKVKMSEYAYNKTTTFKGVTKNHLLNQVVNFRIGIDNKTDDLLDTFTYGIQLSIKKAN